MGYYVESDSMARNSRVPQSTAAALTCTEKEDVRYYDPQ